MNIYQISVTLYNVNVFPLIWRRVQVKSDIRLNQLHDLLQI